MKLDHSFLEGKRITLEPMRTSHIDGLISAGKEPDIWDFVTFALDSSSSVSKFISYVSSLSDKGTGQAYVIRFNETGEIVGGTGYWHIDHRHRELDIGGS